MIGSSRVTIRTTASTETYVAPAGIAQRMRLIRVDALQCEMRSHDQPDAGRARGHERPVDGRASRGSTGGSGALSRHGRRLAIVVVKLKLGSPASGRGPAGSTCVIRVSTGAFGGLSDSRGSKRPEVLEKSAGARFDVDSEGRRGGVRGIGKLRAELVYRCVQRASLAISAGEIRGAFQKWIRPGDFVQVVQGPPPQ
jgi:hypothetical protein